LDLALGYTGRLMGTTANFNLNFAPHGTIADRQKQTMALVSQAAVVPSPDQQVNLTGPGMNKILKNIAFSIGHHQSLGLRWQVGGTVIQALQPFVALFGLNRSLVTLVDREQPEESLLLNKPTNRNAPNNHRSLPVYLVL